MEGGNTVIDKFYRIFTSHTVYGCPIASHERKNAALSGGIFIMI